jgi:hypothetical protein
MHLAAVLRVAGAVVLLSSAGCGSNNKGKIEGTRWSSLATTVTIQEHGPQVLPAGALHLEFGADGKLVMRSGPVTMTGTYVLGAGDVVTLIFDREADRNLAERKTHTEKVAITGDRLTMTDSEGTSVTFEKVEDPVGPPKGP